MLVKFILLLIGDVGRDEQMNILRNILLSVYRLSPNHQKIEKRAIITLIQLVVLVVEYSQGTSGHFTVEQEL